MRVSALRFTTLRSMEIHPITLEQIEKSPNIGELCDEYLRESGIPGIFQIQIRFDIYRAIEASGSLRVLGAFDGDILVGFYLFSVILLPNYGEVVGATNAFFVAATHRNGGTGLRLIKEAEQLAAEAGAVGMLVGAPVRGRLSNVLPRLGYNEVDRLFYRRFA